MFDGKAIYQIFCGRLETASITDHKGGVFKRMENLPWERIYDGGFQYVYMLGVFDYRGPIIVNEERGKQLNREPIRLPSPFAISNHKSFHPDLGTSDDFARLLTIIQKNGLRVLVDFVPNHTGATHPWIQHHPEFYKHSEKNPETAFSGDVFVLDYGQQRVWEEMISVLDYIGSMGVNGVRCDMAHLVPVNFWGEAIDTIKQRYNEFMFLAEAYADSVFDWKPLVDLLNVGFDGVYHEFLYRNLKDESENSRSHWKATTSHIEHVLTRGDRERLIHFLSNHDDPLLESWENLQPALMTIMCCMGGGVLVYNGQLHGVTKRISHHYYDPLVMDLSEFRHLPTWFIDLRDIVLVHSPRLISVTNYQGLVVGKIRFKDQHGLMVANLTEASKEINVTENIAGKGILKGLRPGERLSSGQAELFFTH